MSIKNKKNVSGIVNIGSILIIGYCIINILLLTNVINLVSDEYVPNFYNQSVLEVNEWKKANNIDVIEKYAGNYEGIPVSELLTKVLEDTGYEQMLRTEGAQDRLDNLAELKQ